MTDPWDEKPEFSYSKKLIAPYYEVKEMDAWLEKLKEEWDAILQHHVTQEEGMQKEINELKDKLETVKPLVLELFGHADHGLDSHNPRSFEIRQLRDKIIRSIGESET